MKTRSSWQVTCAVWHAMFMREIVARTMKDRMAWFWMLAEPIAMISLMLLIRTIVLGRSNMLYNAEFVPWLIVGLLGFFLFRENMTRSIGAVDANKTLFSYRQVKPVDAVLVRCFLESTLKSFIFLLFIAAGVLLDLKLLPDLPLEAMFVWLSLWMFGLGIGLLLSVASGLVPEIGTVARIMAIPLLLLSGVIIPITMLPTFLHPYILMNPIVHGVETLRMSFFERYVTLPEIDLMYMWYWTLTMMALGLMLHIRFEMRLKEA
ncbi:ABC transporter permease [Nitrincola sp. MINF-07-Sa-05]|uniref:ABC transporter permease n=1 Tax=Nitrincola salilacus TaxID=3400273 RepID=UPI003917E804